MIAEGLIPLDEETHLPLVILADMSRVHSGTPWNYHHHFFEAHHPELLGDRKGTTPSRSVDMPLVELAGIALRMSRGQYMPQPGHVQLHKEYLPLNDRLPHTLDKKFNATVLALSGVASRWAIDLSKKPVAQQLVYMDDETYVRVTDPRVLCPEDGHYKRRVERRQQVMADFLIRYALQYKIDDMVSPDVIQEFLLTPDMRRRREIGNFILAEALDAVVDPVASEHRDFRRRGMVHESMRSVYVAVRKRVRARGFGGYHDMLEDRLLAA